MPKTAHKKTTKKHKPKAPKTESAEEQEVQETPLVQQQPVMRTEVVQEEVPQAAMGAPAATDAPTGQATPTTTPVPPPAVEPVAPQGGDEIPQAVPVPEIAPPPQPPTTPTVPSATQPTTEDTFITDDNGESGGKKWLIVTIALIVIGVLFVGGLFLLNNSNKESDESEPSPATETEVTPEPSTTPEPEYELSEFKVQVLNGSGISGKAGDVKELLEDGGFEGIDTGNAGAYDYEETVVQMKEDVPEAVFDDIKELLDTYAFDKLEELDEDEDYDIIVIVGSKDAEEETDEDKKYWEK